MEKKTDTKPVFRILIGVSSLSSGRIGLGAGAVQQGNPSVVKVWLCQIWLCMFLLLVLQVSLTLLLERTTQLPCGHCLCLRVSSSKHNMLQNPAGLWSWSNCRIRTMADPKDLVWPDRKMPQLQSPVLHQGSWDRLGSTGFTQTGAINMSVCRVRQDSALKVQDKANNVRCRQGCQPSIRLIANWWVQVKL